MLNKTDISNILEMIFINLNSTKNYLLIKLINTINTISLRELSSRIQKCIGRIIIDLTVKQRSNS